MKAPLVLLLLAVGANAAQLSSSKAECVDGELQGIPGDCRKYYECINGTFETKSCGFFKRYFNSKELKCAWFKRHCLPPEPITTALPTDSTTSPPPTTTSLPPTTSPPQTTTNPPPTTTSPPPTTTSPPPTTTSLPPTTSPPQTTASPPQTTTSPPQTTTNPPPTTTSLPPTTTSPPPTTTPSVPKTTPPGNPVTCQNGDILGIPKDCHKFKECVDGAFVIKTCGFIKRYFDSKTKTCVTFRATCTPDEPKTTARPTQPPVTKSSPPEPKPSPETHSSPSGTIGDAIEITSPIATDNYFSSSSEIPSTFPPKCNNGDRIGVPKDCHKYKECVDGVFVAKSCGFFKRYFDTKSKTCVMHGAKCEPDDPSQDKITPTLLETQVEVCKDGQRQGFPTDCSKYVHCINGTRVVKSCGYFRKFDVKTQKCVLYGAQCETGECMTGDITPVYGDCKKYRLCQNKKFVVKSCGYLRKFDIVSKQCRFSATCAQASCKEGSLHPVEGNCKQYSVCKNGTKQMKTCTWYRKFDSSTKSCAFFGAKCYENPSHLTTPKPAKT